MEKTKELFWDFDYSENWVAGLFSMHFEGQRMHFEGWWKK